MDGTFMGMYQTTIKGIGSFPSADSYNLLFLTSAIISIVSFVLSIVLIRAAVTEEKTLQGLK